MNIFDVNIKDESGDGIYNDGRLIINGGNISNNKGCGINNSDNGELSIKDGFICNNSGRGVANLGKMSVSGGVISDNTSDYSGGGICSDGTLNITGGTITRNSSKENGGGILNEGTLTISGGDISNNHSSKYGGGIYSETSMTINGGTIQNNTAYYFGGGVYAYSSLYLNGGKIINNTVCSEFDSAYGGGLYCDSSLCVSGNPVITGNQVKSDLEDDSKGTVNNLQFYSDYSCLYVTDDLDKSADIGISLYEYPKNDDFVTIVRCAEDYHGEISKDCFFSDNDKYVTDKDGDNVVLKLKPQNPTTPITINPGDYGDANNDGKITAADVLLIRKFIAGQNVPLNEKAADVNCDGKLTAADVLMIRKFITGQNIHLGK